MCRSGLARSTPSIARAQALLPTEELFLAVGELQQRMSDTELRRVNPAEDTEAGGLETGSQNWVALASPRSLEWPTDGRKAPGSFGKATALTRASRLGGWTFGSSSPEKLLSGILLAL